MKMLKTVVIGMAALIALAICLIAYGLYKKSVEPGWKLFGPQRPDMTAEPTATATPSNFANFSLGLGAGCRIVDVRPDGRRAFLVIGPDEGCAAVIVVDVEAGRVLGRIDGR